MASKRRKFVSGGTYEREKHEHLPSEKKKSSLRDDKRKLLIISYLISRNGARVTTQKIVNNAIKILDDTPQGYRILKQEQPKIKKIMSELVAMEWAEAEQREDGYEWYTFTEKGRDALNKAKELVHDNHPLASLEAFEDIVDL